MVRRKCLGQSRRDNGCVRHFALPRELSQVEGRYPSHLSYLFFHTDGDKMLFIIFGLITIAWSFVLYFCLPDSPATAKFLTPPEREFTSLRPKKFQRTTQTKKWDRSQFMETLRDVKTWWFFIFSFVICIPNGGTTSVCRIFALVFIGIHF